MSIAKNTIHYSAALVFQKILGFIYFALIARILGVEDTGLYVFALSFTTIFSVLADIGFAPVLIREIAKAREKTQELFSQVFSVKIIISIATYALVVLFVNILGYPPLTRTLVYIAGLVMVLDSFSLIFWAVFRGHQNLTYEAFGVVGFQTITVGIGLAVLFFGLGVTALIVATLAGSVFYFVFSLAWLLKKLKLKLKLVFDKKTIIWMMKLALPFALAGVFARIYTQIDTVMLSKMSCESYAINLCNQNVGWYGVASKFVLAFQFIPLALAASLFPALSEQHAQDQAKMKATFMSAWRYLALIALPLGLGVIALAPEIVMTVWSQSFLPAVLPLQILMGSLIFLFLTFPNGSLLNATGNQTVNTAYMGIVVILNVVLNAITIPRYAMTGAAVASIVSTFLLFVLGFIKSHELVKFNIWSVFAMFVRLTLAALLMAVALMYAKLYINWIILIPLGALMYFGIGALLGEITKDDLIFFRRLIKR